MTLSFRIFAPTRKRDTGRRTPDRILSRLKSPFLYRHISITMTLIDFFTAYYLVTVMMLSGLTLLISVFVLRYYHNTPSANICDKIKKIKVRRSNEECDIKAEKQNNISEKDIKTSNDEEDKQENEGDITTKSKDANSTEELSNEETKNGRMEGNILRESVLISKTIDNVAFVIMSLLIVLITVVILCLMKAG